MANDAQAQVLEQLLSSKHFTEDTVRTEVDFWFNMGLPRQYLKNSTPEQIARHVQSYLGAKLVADSNNDALNINVRNESAVNALLITRSFVKLSGDGEMRMQRVAKQESPVFATEDFIEKKYLSGKSAARNADGGGSGPSAYETHMQRSRRMHLPSESSVEAKVWRLQAFRSRKPIDPKANVHLRLYFLQAPRFEDNHPLPGERDVKKLGDVKFVEESTEETLQRYQTIMDEVVEGYGPAVRVFHDVYDSEGEVCSLVMIAHSRDDGHGFFVGVPHVYRYHHLFASTKFVEPFANGVVVYSFFLRPLVAVVDESGTAMCPKDDFVKRVERVARDVRLHYVLPQHNLTPLLQSATLSAEEVAYTFCAWKFAFHFLNRGQGAHQQLSEMLRHAGDDAAAALSELRVAFQTHSFNEGSIKEAIFSHPELARHLYKDFASRHVPQKLDGEDEFGSDKSLTDGVDAVEAHIKRTVHTDLEQAVFSAFLKFNVHILKTNFYRKNKTALSFRLNPEFLSGTVYESTPYGVFMVVGAEFRGFHIRFRDVARGGIRLVRSRFPQAYANNVSNLFDECYNLASTQQRKNKDLPEGGSKGVILLGLNQQDKGDVAFKKYVDSLLDLLLPNERVVQHDNSQEILFLGPDEGTADLMDWASQHARHRGYAYWKGFTTGKSTSLGGIPHDMYGMTTRSVRAYVNGIQAKMGLDGTQCTKVQTGGPDGDLGSNEIKLGHERTIAIVDGSGVLYDANGINIDELRRLANEKPRQAVSYFDMEQLSSDGYRVLVDETDVRLPDGSLVESGLQFRNGYHLNPDVTADFFVPCGGRPAAVNESNWRRFCYDNNDKLRFTYIVEGANLFFTQDARLKLEKAGVVVIKDASANKGGVTSSSLEVLAALALTDEEFKEHMSVVDEANPPEFYRKYVEEVQARIKSNAELEFEKLWLLKANEPLSVASDSLSQHIVKLKDAIQASSLFQDDQLRGVVLKKAIPRTLQALIPLDELERRLPQPYLQAVFAAYLASRFVYTAEDEAAAELALHQFLNSLRAEA
eukprot:TRINITY_DN9807_c0_g2_i1.p1 TRINITY_DN9807_c0_g2~~TRINITY_DN9807_c0_g2_i1.p1  ORF type:complete len:1038 (+),score=326.03 TRINITY_DN9807_c0_g2_i1:113-3226(+)